MGLAPRQPLRQAQGVPLGLRGERLPMRPGRPRRGTVPIIPGLHHTRRWSCSKPERHPLPWMILIALTCLLGLFSRRFAGHLPGFVARYAGDTLWALALFLFLGLIRPRTATERLAVIALILSLSVEISQLYHAPSIDAIRQTTLGGLLLAFGFLWRDLACYTAGCPLGMVLGWSLFRRHRARSKSAT